MFIIPPPILRPSFQEDFWDDDDDDDYEDYDDETENA